MAISMSSKKEDGRVALIKECAKYIANNGSTIRETAKKFNISKSWLHKCVKEILPKRDIELYNKVRAVLDKNNAEKHLRGGKATKEKYARLKKKV